MAPDTAVAALPAAGGARDDAGMPAAPAAWAIRLALGTNDLEPAELDWTAVWQIALRERLAMLCWLRSGDIIRRHAPRDIVAAWRRHAIAAEARGRTQLAAIREAVDALEAVSVTATLLKGRALGVLAYGDPGSRVSTDIDLLVKLRDRPRAASVLASLGWRHRAGRAPWDETWQRLIDGRTHFLEVHSTLLHDTLAHHTLAPRLWRRVDVGGLDVRTLNGPELPVYLAAHVVAHDRPALLWFLDLHGIWTAMSPSERAAACTAARAAGLDRHLDWAVERAAALERAGNGADEALELLGILPDGSRIDRPMVRSLQLAPGAVAAARVTGAWLWPRPIRRSARATLVLAANRVRRLLPGRDALATSTHAPASVARSPRPANSTSPSSCSWDVSSRALRLERAELFSLVRESIDAGAGLWITVRGASMMPAIPPGAQVRLGPLSERSLRKGDVVLAALPAGLPVLHRVRKVQNDVVVLQGDALPAPDAAVDRSAVIARADLMRMDDEERAIPRRGRRPWRRIGHWWLSRLARDVARAD